MERSRVKRETVGRWKVKRETVGRWQREIKDTAMEHRETERERDKGLRHGGEIED